jgi:transglutaminase-like putative cysteine protease
MLDHRKVSLQSSVNELSPFTNRKQRLIINSVVLLSALPHALEIPLWTTLCVALTLLYRFAQDADIRFKNKYFVPIPLWPMRALAVLSFLGILWQFQSVLGIEPGSAFLVLLMGLKLLESRTYRDAMILIILSFFVHMTWLLMSQTLTTTLYLGFAVIYSIRALVVLHAPPNSKQHHTRSAIVDLAQALPLFVLMFVLFPRFSSPLVGLFSKGGATVGFSGEIDPGSVTQLSTSKETAFRVVFSGRIPAHRDLYWRGSTLTETSGFAWKNSKPPSPQPHTVSTLSQEARIKHEILLEPRYGRWLFALDVPQSIEWTRPNKNRIQKQDNGDFLAQVPLNQRTQYKAVSTFREKKLRLEPNERKINLEVPEQTKTSEVMALVKKLRGEKKSEEQINKSILSHFSKGGFRYAREIQPVRSLDDFIFQKKEGFCEHFASSHALLLRLAGVPARLITGFHGGVYNSYGEYLLVGEQEAHSWVEYFSEGKGWIRTDPTAVVRPRGLDDLATGEAGDIIQQQSQGFIESTMLAWDAVSNKYALFLLNFDFEKQLDLLSSFGFGHVSRWQLFFLLISAVSTIVALVLRYSRPQLARPDRLAESYQQILSKLEKAGFPKEPHWGPQTFLENLRHAIPSEERSLKELEQILLHYQELRYRSQTSHIEDLNQFKRSVRNFRIKKQSA